MSEKINVQLSPGKRFPLRIYLMLCRKCPSVAEKMSVAKSFSKFGSRFFTK